MPEEMENTGTVPVNEPEVATDRSNVKAPPGTKGENVSGMAKSGLNTDEVVTRTLGLPDSYDRQS